MATRKISRSIGLLAIGVVALGACAPQEQYVWHKPGASQTDLQRDGYECERDMRMSAASFGAGIGGAAQAEAFIQRCMAARGYALTSAFAAASDPQRDRTVDAQGNQYADGDKIVCQYSGAPAVVEAYARACVSSSGRILGPSGSQPAVTTLPVNGRVRDAWGRIYANGETILCSLPGPNAPASMSAQSCILGYGAIVGRPS